MVEAQAVQFAVVDDIPYFMNCKNGNRNELPYLLT